MRILYATQFPLETATTSRFLNYAKEMGEQGEEATLLVTCENAWAGRDHEVLHQEEAKGVSIRYWPRLHKPLPLRIPSSISWLYSAWKYAQKSDIIHLAKTIPTSTIAIHLARSIEGKPLVVELDDWDSIGGFASKSKAPLAGKLVLTALEEWMPRHSDLVTVVSKTLYDRVLDMGVDKEQVLYLPISVDLRQFNPERSGQDVRRKLGLGNHPTIIYVGVMLKEGVEWRFLLRIMSEVRQEVRDAKLLVVGYGPALPDMKRYAKELQLGDSVLFVGGKPHAGIPLYLAAADIAIHILGDQYLIDRARSNTKIAEYMAMGKPIVATDLGEVHEALKDNAGILVKGYSPEDYAKGIKRILSNKGLQQRLGRKARKRAEEDYSSEIVVRTLRQAYSKLL